MQDMCVRPVVYSHEDLVPEVALRGDGGGVHAEAGVVAGGVDEGRRHGGVGGRKVVIGAGGRRPVVHGWCQQGPPCRHSRRWRRWPGAVAGRRVHVAPPGRHARGGRAGRGGRRRARDGGLGPLLRSALHER
jgi:hypothetical protein